MQHSQFFKISLFLFSGAVTSAFAEVLPVQWSDTPGGVWQLGIEGAYLDQTNNLLKTVSPTNDPLYVLPGELSENFPFLYDDPGYSWGYGVSLGYLFPSRKYDIQGNFFQMESDSSESRVYNNVDFAVGEPSYTANVDFEQDNEYRFLDADLTVGTYVQSHRTLMFRFGFGIDYMDVEQKEHSYTTAESVPLPPDEGNHVDVHYSNQFQGIGPLFTLDGQWLLHKYWSIVGGVGVSGLYGESKSKFRYNLKELDGSTIVDTTVSQDDDKWVFGLAGNLGLRFNHRMGDHWIWGIEAGYQASEYFDALESQRNDIPGSSPSFTFSSDDDYSNYGPYARLVAAFL